MFQSTHSRGVRRAVPGGSSGHSEVSIHALTRSATIRALTGGDITKVSIHALTRSATAEYQSSGIIAMFQSTHSRGVRLDMPNDLQQSVASFNPRTHEECDMRPFGTFSGRKCFNPRTHEECDRIATAEAKKAPCFNPRTHEECDNAKVVATFRICVSIHALTRSATLPHNMQPTRLPVSIHALTRSATVSFITGLFTGKFQSTHSRGVRLTDRGKWNLIDEVSIHALTRSATNKPWQLPISDYVSIHALTRSATPTLH